jgi:hypothetical protein
MEGSVGDMLQINGYKDWREVCHVFLNFARPAQVLNVAAGEGIGQESIGMSLQTCIRDVLGWHPNHITNWTDDS